MVYEPKKPDNDKKKEDIIREQLITYEDYAALDDGNRYELAAGKLELMSPGPSISHQIVSFEIHKRISQTCEESYLILCAPLDVILSSHEVRQPDLIMIRRDRMNIVKSRGIVGPPDLVVEVLSPSTAKRDKLDKTRVYARYGIPEYWLVDPLYGMLEQYELKGEGYELNQIYSGDEPISSKHVSCVSFTLQEIMNQIPDLQD